MCTEFKISRTNTCNSNYPTKKKTIRITWRRKICVFVVVCGARIDENERDNVMQCGVFTYVQLLLDSFWIWMRIDAHRIAQSKIILHMFGIPNYVNDTRLPWTKEMKIRRLIETCRSQWTWSTANKPENNSELYGRTRCEQHFHFVYFSWEIKWMMV